MLIAGRAQTVDGKVRQRGEPVPEAETWAPFMLHSAKHVGDILDVTAEEATRIRTTEAHNTALDKVRAAQGTVRDLSMRIAEVSDDVERFEREYVAATDRLKDLQARKTQAEKLAAEMQAVADAVIGKTVDKTKLTPSDRPSPVGSPEAEGLSSSPPPHSPDQGKGASRKR